MKINDLSSAEIRKIGFLERQEHGNFIDGTLRAPIASGYLSVVDPATEMIVARAPDSTAGDIDMAVAAARRAFQAPDWAGLRPADRERLLYRLSILIEEHADELSALETLQSGKLQSLARMVDVSFGAEFVRYMAGWATKIEGQTLPSSLPGPPGSAWFTYTRREPLGVVGAIVPWNFPLAIALWKIAPALAVGCTVVLKPSEETPLTALRLAELAMQAGFPAGVLNVVCGRGSSAGAALAKHPGIDKLSFTGSTGVGQMIGHAAIDTMARFTLELGGKSPAIVLEDADPEATAQGIAMGIFFNQGQVCTAGSRVYIHRTIFGRVTAALATAADAMKVGSGFDASAQIGPLVSKRQYDRVMGFLNSARAEGARSLTVGTNVHDAGYFVKPTVLVDATDTMRVVREEIFGPVVVCMPFDDIDEVVQRANDSPYGLAASIWSNDLAKVHRLIPRLRAGMVWVNTHNMLDANLPLGGYKHSGYGHDMGRAAVESYTSLKSVCMSLGSAG